jgi:hypothetical protein
MSEGHPYDAVRNFEAALCKYTGARFAVTTNSCTMALLLAGLGCTAHAATVSVDCDAGKTIMGALPTLKPGDTLSIFLRTFDSTTGTQVENWPTVRSLNASIGKTQEPPSAEARQTPAE